jgi:ferredoxin
MQALLPFLAVCETALSAARQAPGLRQVLVILPAGTGPAAALPPMPELTVRSEAGQTGRRTGHPDILLALSMGFTHVLWQEEAGRAAEQHQEKTVAEYLGAKGRVSLFSGRDELAARLADLAFLPLEAPPLPAGAPPMGPDRRSTARACASFLLRQPEVRVPLPDFAPYGSVVVNSAACSGCSTCALMCPSDALAVGPEGGGLLFTEAACMQCGMCRSACPEDAIELQPRLYLDGPAGQPRPVSLAEPYRCESCGAPAGERGMVERVLARLKEGVFTAVSPDVEKLVPMCGGCRRQAAQNIAPAPAPARILNA